jgi:hypothetical protein
MMGNPVIFIVISSSLQDAQSSYGQPGRPFQQPWADSGCRDGFVLVSAAEEHIEESHHFG